MPVCKSTVHVLPIQWYKFIPECICLSFLACGMGGFISAKMIQVVLRQWYILQAAIANLYLSVSNRTPCQQAGNDTTLQNIL